MPDSRAHRGPHPEDARLFAAAAWPVLREAMADLCWLLSREYATRSAVKLVGDRYQLAARQRTAVERCACSDAALARRGAHRVGPESLQGRELWADGYNLLTTIEAAMAGGVILAGRDGAFRDMASMHGSFRKVCETRPALELLGRIGVAFGASVWVWYLDRPVSNSGRLKTLMQELAAAHGWPWRVELVPNPDPILANADQIVVSADSVILDACQSWFNLGREAVTVHIPTAHVIDLSDPSAVAPLAHEAGEGRG